MSDFNDFRIVLTRNIQEPGTWDVLLEDCPVVGLKGHKGTIKPTINANSLARLRNQHGWPDLAELTTIGKAVWQTLMNPNLEAAFFAGLNQSRTQNRGMRLIVAMVGEESEPALPGNIRLQELPFEALYSDSNNFLAPSPATPISRSLKFGSDREPQHITLPLRILVVVATPNDKPASNMQKEKNSIQDALTALTGKKGGVEIEFCEPPTRSELLARLEKQCFHILHFVGHGAFDIEGNDPTPRAYLCLEGPDRTSDPVDAKTLEILLQHSGIKLVIMTACASASPAFGDLSPDDIQKIIGPFDGIAQTLVAGESGINAVVAMQFDFEEEAAKTFSKTFYTQLLSPDRKLDEVVALCRKALIAEMNAGHRAWITPVVYWRCRDGKVFEIAPLSKEHDPVTASNINEIKTIISVYLKHIAAIMALPQEVQKAAAPETQKWQKEVDEQQFKLGQLLGETLRLRGGKVKPGKTIKCCLTFRLRTAARIGNVSARVCYPADKVTYSSVKAGEKIQGNIPFVQNTAMGELTLLVLDASKSTQWSPEEYELALLTFTVKTGVTDPFLELTLKDCKVQREGADTECEALNAILFVS